MAASAPRLDGRLIAALARLDRTDLAIADTHRRLGLVADAIGLPRPSYEQVRVTLHRLRAGRRGPKVGLLLLEIALQQRPPESLLDILE
jgi:hypothetical protein